MSGRWPMLRSSIGSPATVSWGFWEAAVSRTRTSLSVMPSGTPSRSFMTCPLPVTPGSALSGGVVAAHRAPEPRGVCTKRRRQLRRPAGRVHRDALRCRRLASRSFARAGRQAAVAGCAHDRAGRRRRACGVCTSMGSRTVTSSRRTSTYPVRAARSSSTSASPPCRALSTITARGAFGGTRAYCAPEQIRGEANIHSDLYALGSVLFEALTGQRANPSGGLPGRCEGR